MAAIASSGNSPTSADAARHRLCRGTNHHNNKRLQEWAQRMAETPVIVSVNLQPPSSSTDWVCRTGWGILSMLPTSHIRGDIDTILHTHTHRHECYTMETGPCVYRQERKVKVGRSYVGKKTRIMQRGVWGRTSDSQGVDTIGLGSASPENPIIRLCGAPRLKGQG
jgi:hypothetical protein